MKPGGEVTNIVAMKGKPRELVKHHSTSIIPLYKTTHLSSPDMTDTVQLDSPRGETRPCAERNFAKVSEAKTRALLKLIRFYPTCSISLYICCVIFVSLFYLLVMMNIFIKLQFMSAANILVSLHYVCNCISILCTVLH